MPPTAKRVLCVGDQEDVCRLITTWLGLEGFEAVTADGSRGPLELAARERFDLIIINEQSSADEGLERCRAFRARAPATPILLCTSNPFEPRPGQAKEAGARELLVHDGDARKLTEAVRRLTDRGAD